MTDQPMETESEVEEPDPSGVEEAEELDVIEDDAPDDDGEEVEPVETAPEAVEIEYQGKKFTVAPELKDAFLLQADYTKKTQEVAEQRQALEASQAQFKAAVERQQALSQEYGQLQTVGAQLQEYAGVDWATAMAQDPDRAQVALAEYTQLRDRFGMIQQDIRQKESASASEKQRDSAKRIEQARKELQRDIPEYNPEYGKQLGQLALSQGISAAELAAVNDDPRYVRILHLAQIGQKALETKNQAGKPKPKPVTPAAVVPSGGKPRQTDPDKLSDEAWLDRRNKQLAKKRAG